MITTILKTLTGHAFPVTDIAFSPCGSTLASVSSGDLGTPGEIILWDPLNGTNRCVLHAAMRYSSVLFSPDGEILITAGSREVLGPGEIRLWNILDGQTISVLEGHELGVSSIAISPDGKTLAAASTDSLRLWDLATGVNKATLATFALENKSPGPVAFSPDGKHLAAGMSPASQDGLNFPPSEIRLWDVETLQISKTFQSRFDPVGALVFHHGGKILASGGGHPFGIRGELIIWDLADVTNAIAQEGAISDVGCLAFSPDGNMLVSGHSDKSIQFWQVSTGTNISSIPAHNASVRSLAFSRADATLASASDDATVKLWLVQEDH